VEERAAGVLFAGDREIGCNFGIGLRDPGEDPDEVEGPVLRRDLLCVGKAVEPGLVFNQDQGSAF
jgi:hypothetical protein